MPRFDPLVRVMTWNVRYDNPEDGVHSWPHRREAVAEVWASLEPDLVFLQEALVHQYEDLRSDQGEFGFVGVGREGGDAGEFVPLAYRTNRFSLLASGHFWLAEDADTPGALGWDAACPRVVTWARLLDRSTGWLFVAASIHLDHVGPRARTLGVRLLAERLLALAQGAAVVIGGDFNAEPGSEPHGILEAHGFRDTAQAGIGGYPFSYHGFDEDTPQLIDFVYGSSGVGGTEGRPVNLRPRGVTPSDHVPIISRVDLRGWVVFDMDGTLYRTETSTVPACRRALAAFGLPCPSNETLFGWIGDPAEVFCRRLAPGLSDPDFALLTQQIDLFELEAVRTHGELYPGILEALTELRESGYRLAVCSLGSPDYLEAIVSTTGIRGFFDVVMGASPAVQGKDELLATMQGFLGPRAVLVGDRTHDVSAAHRNGIPSIGALWGYGPYEAAQATAAAASPHDVVGLVNRLLGQYRGPR